MLLIDIDIPFHEFEKVLSEEIVEYNIDDNDIVIIDGVETVDKTSKAKSKRQRCKECAACLAPPCEQCNHCLDKVKNGGRGVLKKACM